MTGNIKTFFFEGSIYKLLLFVSLLLTLVLNGEFYAQTLAVYTLGTKNLAFLGSLVLLLFLLTYLFFSLTLFRWNIKYGLIFILLVSSLSSYFMSTYHIIIDEIMIQNIVETNMNEAFDLLSLKQVSYLLFLGISPSLYVYYYKIVPLSLKKEFFLRAFSFFVTVLIIISIYFAFSKYYSSFFREHKVLRFYVNPVYWVYASGKFIGMQFKDTKEGLKIISDDAKVIQREDEAKKLVILVVGETARADHFSLNGYTRKTNPLLEKEVLLNFENMSSCGTSTAVSVPCMFSMYNSDTYSYNKALSTENVLDVLHATKEVEVLWRDNNSDSKGVALRVEYEDYKSSENNTLCDEECRDEGMLVGLDAYVNKHKNKNILIVLHQMGNHGPAYYKRYPLSFEKFRPVCQTNQLQECTQEEISNAYDNAILYTDYFLSKSINFLKKYEKSHNVAMIYMSDHGESLGENGIYLHGLPSFIAPKEQSHVASLMWFGKKMKKELKQKDISCLSKNTYTQDNLFHTLLGMFKIQSLVYDKKMDILNQED